MSVGDVAAGAAGFLGCLLMLATGLLTIGMGYTGIAEEFGIGWGVAALGAGIVFRFTLPLVVGVFFLRYQSTRLALVNRSAHLRAWAGIHDTGTGDGDD